MDHREIFKIMSLLFIYPEKEIIDYLKDYEPESFYSENLNKFLEFLKNTDIQDIQKEYVRSFDFNKDGTLYLTYHKFKDDVQRGTYLAKLIDYYRKKGFEFSANELPDFLPVILEFVSEIDFDTGIQVIKSFENEIKKINESLNSLSSPYKYLIETLLDLTKQREVS